MAFGRQRVVLGRDGLFVCLGLLSGTTLPLPILLTLAGRHLDQEEVVHEHTRPLMCKVVPNVKLVDMATTMHSVAMITDPTCRILPLLVPTRIEV